VDAAAEEADQVDGRLVGPVRVFDDDQMELVRLADLSQQRGEQLVTLDARPAQVRQRATELFGDVQEGTEGAWREQAVAGPQTNRASGRSCVSCSTKADLPTPASPLTKTSRP